MDADRDDRGKADSTTSGTTSETKGTPQRPIAEEGGGGAEWQGDAAPADSGREFARTVDRQLSDDAAAAEAGGGTGAPSDDSPGSAGNEPDRQQEPALQEDERSIVKPDNS
jgi:hypothetical protein